MSTKSVVKAIIGISVFIVTCMVFKCCLDSNTYIVGSAMNGADIISLAMIFLAGVGVAIGTGLAIDGIMGILKKDNN